MTDSAEKESSDRREEQRHHPYEYLPHVEIYETGRSSGDRLTGIVRNESQGGFSAQFDYFPYDEGDVLDVRVGYQRAWAKVAWVQRLRADLIVAGFHLHPEEFLERLDQ